MKCPLLMLIIKNPFEFLAEQERKYFQLQNVCKTVFTVKKQIDNHRALLWSLLYDYDAGNLSIEAKEKRGVKMMLC